MPALFPRWTNAAARATLLAIAALIVGVPATLMAWARTSFATGAHARVRQPMPFDHRVHVQGLKIDCRYCHATVETAANAGLPPTVACVACHNSVWLASRPFAPVRASLASNRPIPWRRVNTLPQFVFFDHSAHAAKGVGCETCHGRVDQMASVEQATSLSMAWCVRCHRDPSPYLRARSEITTMGWTPKLSRLSADSAGARAMHTYRVRRLTSCSTCHR
jgi:hypothetical protein